MAIVYTFEKWDGTRMAWSKYKMTAEGLASDSSRSKVAGTEQVVPDDMIDRDGRYVPRA